MARETDFDAVFDALHGILDDYAKQLTVKADEPGDFQLETAHIMPNKQPLFFAAVQKKKSYVSYHLMPVYVFPELLDGLSAALKARMQGKSCFNFKAVDEPLLSELAELTDAGFKRYEQAGYV